MSSEKRDASPEASPLKGPAPKAVPEDTSDVTFEDGIPLSPMAGEQQVQFISGAPVNGDAKVEIGDSGGTGAAPTFVGLGKEELMKYANDPFWVKLRWFLFILFWVLWIAMLVGAIVIIVLAHRCAEKKTAAEMFYQMKRSDLAKDGTPEFLEALGVGNIIIVEALQHEPDNEPEAVTNFNAFHSDANVLTETIKKLKEKGIQILLQIVPNHSGTSHEWFNQTGSEKYVRQPYESVKTSVWRTQDKKQNVWTPDNRSGFEDTAYLQQFSGPLADLNFRDEGIIDAFKEIFQGWREKNINGFSIPKASFLFEDLDGLMNMKSLINQPNNLKVLSRITGSSKGPLLVELDDADDALISEYADKGMTPILKIDASSPEKVQKALETLNKNPVAATILSDVKPDKIQVLNLLISGSGCHSVVPHDPNAKEFIKQLSDFQKKEDNHRGKDVKLQYNTTNNIVAGLRTETSGLEHLILGNLGATSDSFSPSVLNITDPIKGKVVVATPSAQQKAGDEIGDNISLNPNSGLVIQLEKKEVSS